MLKFAFYIHNHQPFGNFEDVFEHAYTHAYLPLLTCLMKHKRIKFGIHNSGPLLEYLVDKHPDYIELLREVLKRGQAEVLSSAYSEPILGLIPQRDAIEQIKYFNDYIYKLFDYVPQGLWLTERVWEPGLIKTLLDAGVEYTMLDDTIFHMAGLRDHELHTYYVTEDNGRVLKIFPISMKLRYLIPFHAVDETISYLRDEEAQKENALKILADDGEKFGVWPGTHDWVYNQSWFEQFLSRIECEPWIETVFLNQIIQEPPIGRIYLPPSSYEEMGEWVLSPPISRQYKELKKTTHRTYYPFIHGGYFKNFLRKYPEANLMHKRMVWVSEHVSNDLEAKLALWRGQCSCAYWHGIFGGLYLPHLRAAVYKNLITAESTHIKEELTSCDFDADGEKEIVVSNENFFAVMKPKSGAFIELDDRMRKINLLHYLGRREETYHHKIPPITEEKEVKSIHDVFHSKERELSRHLIYDTYERAFCLDRQLDRMPSVEDFQYGKNIGTLLDYTHHEISSSEPLNITFFGPLEKSLELTGEKLRTLRIRYRGSMDLFGVEFSLGMWGADLSVDGEKSLFESWDISDLKEFRITAEDSAPLIFRAGETFRLLSYPIETVSSSEAGLERNFQGFALLLIFTKLPVLSIIL
jgi:alpha-amylase/alpha-mannosidase (GH57 family)